MILVSVVIPTYKRNRDLTLCLKAIGKNISFNLNENVEIIVTDDSPNGAAKELIASSFPTVQWTKGPGKGPAANRNHGASLAKGEWLIFLDDDCIPTQDWLIAYQDKFNNGFQVLEGRTVTDRVQIRLNEEAPINEEGGNLWSCNFAIKSDVFFEMGMFDEHFPYAAMEDTDFYVRLLQAKRKILFTPNALVVHPWRVITPFNGGLQKRLNSQKYFLDKHLPNRNISFRWARSKMLILSTCQDIYKLIQFKGRGALYFLERVYFNWRMIFI
ncbi:MAG: glycosyltransferase [Hydrotalea sp.]|nr:glycosyltransferase [Hydrotalea sp.]